MATHAEIPTMARQPFSERVSILGITYTWYIRWNWVSQNWYVDVWDATSTTPILMNIPLVTGCDLLEQFGYLPLGAHTILQAISIGPNIPPDQVPTFDNLGTDGHVFVTTP